MVSKEDCNKDIFEMLAVAIGCNFVSDMRYEPYNTLAKRVVIEKFDLQDVPLKTLSDLYNYLYRDKVDFQTYEEAISAFENIKRTFNRRNRQ